MTFYTTRELRTTPKSMWDSLAADGEVVITSNGKPRALLIDLEYADYESTLRAVRQARAMMAVNEMRGIAAQRGYMGEGEIDAEIAAARAERRG